jgi:hypothetical protein
MALGAAVGRKLRLARGQRGHEHEPAHAGERGGFGRALGPADVAEVEAHRVGRVDHPGDVQDGVGTLDQPGQRAAVREVAAEPFDPLARRLLASREDPQRHTPAARFVDHRLPDEAGAAGDGDRHSRTSWSRWITAERGA